MTAEKKVNGTTIKVLRDDITLLDIQSFVYYAQHDLDLGSGFGAAIAQRGGPSVKKDLEGKGPLETGGVVISEAGELKADYIIHAVGPRFQEPELPKKLKQTILNCLKQAEDKGIEKIAFPAMGCGFYGVPLDLSAKVTFETLKEYLKGETKLKEVVVCVNDHQDLPHFTKPLEAL